MTLPSRSVSVKAGSASGRLDRTTFTPAPGTGACAVTAAGGAELAERPSAFEQAAAARATVKSANTRIRHGKGKRGDAITGEVHRSD